MKKVVLHNDFAKYLICRFWHWHTRWLWQDLSSRSCSWRVCKKTFMLSYL